MTIETALYPTQLNATLPPQSDIVREGAGHLRLLKTVVKTTFPNLGGAWNATQTEANYIVGVTSPIQAQINSKGAIAGQTWTGAHVFSGTAAVPTLAQGTNTTGAASTAFVQAEWATRLPNYTAPITANSTELNHLVGVTSGVQSQINAKGAIAGQTWTGTHSFPNTTTVGPLTPTIQGYLSTATSDVQAQINSKAAKAGDTYIGSHNYTSATITVPTLAAGSSGNSAASVDYANALAFAAALPAQTGNAGKFVKTNGTSASWSSIATTDLIAGDVPAQSLNGGQLAGLRNKIINGSFGINQRAYASGATTTAGQYTLDRWKVTGTGGVTFSTTNNKTTVTIPSGQTLQQVIEGSNLESGAYVLSWEGTAQGRINGGAYGASGVVTATITGGANTTIEFNAGTVALVMFEKSSVATPFEHRPYGLELALCQRYYFRARATGTGPTVFAYGYNYSTTSANVTIPFPVPMRSAPSALEQSGVASDYVIAHGAASTACSSVPTLFGGTSNVMGSLIFTVASGLTVGQGVLGTSANSNANAYLGFPAEL